MFRSECISAMKSFKGMWKEEVSKMITSSIITQIKSAQSFYLGDSRAVWDAGFGDENRKILYEDFCYLPYNNCWMSAHCNGLMAKDSEVDQKAFAVSIFKNQDTVSMLVFYKVCYRIYNEWPYSWQFFPVALQFSEKYIGCKISKFAGYHYPKIAEGAIDYGKEVSHELSTVAAFLKLLSCKNITTRTILPDKKINAKRIKTRKEPIFSYRVLDVILPSKRVVYDLKEVGCRTVRLHLCRGHFKEYTKDRPLFGKYSGRYWWQPIARGDKAAGVIGKSYKIQIRKAA